MNPYRHNLGKIISFLSLLLLQCEICQKSYPETQVRIKRLGGNSDQQIGCQLETHYIGYVAKLSEIFENLQISIETKQIKTIVSSEDRIVKSKIKCFI